jgi:hypothetical protein
MFSGSRVVISSSGAITTETVSPGFTESFFLAVSPFMAKQPCSIHFWIRLREISGTRVPRNMSSRESASSTSQIQLLPIEKVETVGLRILRPRRRYHQQQERQMRVESQLKLRF